MLRWFSSWFLLFLFVQWTRPSTWKFCTLFWTFSQVGLWDGNGEFLCHYEKLIVSCGWHSSNKWWVVHAYHIHIFSSTYSHSHWFQILFMLFMFIYHLSFTPCGTYPILILFQGCCSWPWKWAGETCGCWRGCRSYLWTCFDEWLEWYARNLSYI